MTHNQGVAGSSPAGPTSARHSTDEQSVRRRALLFRAINMKRATAGQSHLVRHSSKRSEERRRTVISIAPTVRRSEGRQYCLTNSDISLIQHINYKKMI
jgi:hypothetical protein